MTEIIRYGACNEQQKLKLSIRFIILIEIFIFVVASLEHCSPESAKIDLFAKVSRVTYCGRSAGK